MPVFSYDASMGRCSREIAARFFERIDMAKKLNWLEVGFETGVRNRGAVRVDLATVMVIEVLVDLQYYLFHGAGSGIVDIILVVIISAFAVYRSSKSHAIVFSVYIRENRHSELIF